MSMIKYAGLTFAIALTAAGSALAQDATSIGRYVMEKTENGFVRMDTATGVISTCQTRADQLVCQMSADDRDAFGDEIGDLHARIKALEDKVAALTGGDTPTRLPTDSELDDSFGLMEKFMKRFMGMAKELEKEFAAPEPVAPPVPDKTSLR